jgi:hypothetical protein
MKKEYLLKLFLFFFGIELIVFGISFGKWQLAFMGVINTIIILFMFFDIGFQEYIRNLYNKVKFLAGTFSVSKPSLEISSKVAVPDSEKIKKFLLNVYEVVKFFYIKG